jgi:hypothetical protein
MSKQNRQGTTPDASTTTTGTPSKGKVAGSIKQYATIGGGTKAPENQDGQASSVPAVETPPPETSAQKKKATKPERDKQTVYLEPDLNDWVRARVRKESRRLKRRVEISEVVNEAIRRMMEDLEG